MSLQEMIAEFDVKDLHKSGAVFDIDKLRWFNRQYLLNMPESDLSDSVLRIMEEAILKRGLNWNSEIGVQLLPMLRERISVLEDLKILAGDGELDYFFSNPLYDPAEIPGKKGTTISAIKHLSALRKILDEIAESEFREPEKIKASVWDYATKEGTGAVLWPFRYSLTGLARSPDPFFVASVLGKQTSIERVEAAISALDL